MYIYISYIGYPLPFHGENATVYRPSQLITVLESVHEVDTENMTGIIVYYKSYYCIILLCII